MYSSAHLRHFAPSPLIYSIRSEKIQQLKDILNIKYPEEEPAPEQATQATEASLPNDSGGAPAPAEPTGIEGGPAPATAVVEAECTTADQPAEHGESSLSLPSTGSHMDQMDTLAMDWPPQPQYPKTTLKRWCQPKPGDQARRNARFQSCKTAI